MSSATPSRRGPNRSRPRCHRRNASPPLCFTSIRHPSELSAFASTNKAYASAALSISLASTSPSGPITRYVAIPSHCHLAGLIRRLHEAPAAGSGAALPRYNFSIGVSARTNPRVGRDQLLVELWPATQPCGNRTRPRRQQMTLWHVVKDSASSLLRGQQIDSLGKHSGGRVEHGTPARAVCPSSAAVHKDRLRVDAEGGNAICVAAQGFGRYLIRCASRRLPSSAPFLLSA
jgi:hypothetical protein